jgi:uncharacterized Zn finger protein
MTQVQEAMKCDKCGAVEESHNPNGSVIARWRDANGAVMEPDFEWKNHWRCMNCGRIERDAVT